MEKTAYQKTRLRTQILLGIILFVPNLGVMFLQRLNPVPLYMDTLFTTTATFFGPVCGMICATLFHLFCTIFIDQNAFAFLWSICSYTMVLIIWLYMKKRQQLGLIDILLLVFITAIIISIEGALLFTIMNVLDTYDSQTKIKFSSVIMNTF